MPWWPHVMLALPQLVCDGPHVPSIEFLLPVTRMVPWELAIPWTSGNFWISHRACVPGQNCLLLPGVFPAFGFIFSSLFTPINGVLPFTPLDVLPFIEVTKGKPNMACFLYCSLGSCHFL